MLQMADPNALELSLNHLPSEGILIFLYNKIIVLL